MNIWTRFEFIVFFKNSKYEVVKIDREFNTDKFEATKDLIKKMIEIYGDEYRCSSLIKSYTQTY